MDTKIVTITDFIRKFGEYADMLPKLDKIILTREGRPFATIKATPEEKNKQLLVWFEKWKGKGIDWGDDEFWKKVLTRKNRKKPITL